MSDRQKEWQEVEAQLRTAAACLASAARRWQRPQDVGALEMFRIAAGRIELLRQDAEFLATHLEISEDELDLMDLTRNPDQWEENQ